MYIYIDIVMVDFGVPPVPAISENLHIYIILIMRFITLVHWDFVKIVFS